MCLSEITKERLLKMWSHSKLNRLVSCLNSKMSLTPYQVDYYSLPLEPKKLKNRKKSKFTNNLTLSNRKPQKTIQIMNDGIQKKQDGGQKINLESFEVIEALGKGSFGSVYLVRKHDGPQDKYFAMKILEKDKVLAQNLIRYAKTERNVLSLANHQFIVSLNYAF